MIDCLIGLLPGVMNDLPESVIQIISNHRPGCHEIISSDNPVESIGGYSARRAPGK
jgi:hypothetical protein